MTVTATDYALDAPSVVSAGLLTIRLRNRGLVPHHVQLVRLDSGRTLRDLEHQLVANGALPRWAREVGGTGPIEPGLESDITVLVGRGRHVLLCAERSSDGTGAVMRGMYRELTVSGVATQTRPPLSDAALVLGDTSIVLRGRLAAGHRRIHVGNGASRPLDVLIYRLRDGRRESDLTAWLERRGGTGPATVVAGAVGLAPGTWGVVGLRLTSGTYAIVRREPEAPGRSAGASPLVLQWIRVK